MEDWAPTDGGFDIDALHIALWYEEVVLGAIEAIAIKPGDNADDQNATWTLHTYKKVPKRSLVIRVDPEHDDPPPANTELVTRGEARIEGEVTKVSLFRKL